MNFCGIVCEFNPFHNGHEYLIEEARKRTNEDVVCLMSGDFVQRGDPAITDKFSRARFAVNSGATMVLELPTIFACSNAENFAYGAIKILKALGATHIAFGVEDDNIELLQKIAELKFENSIEFQNSFKNEIQNGINFNTALKRSIEKNINDKTVHEILKKPNNILAIEYLTAIKKLNAKITPIAIKRCDNGMLSSSPSGKFLSASSIKSLILNKKSYTDYIPKNAKLTNFFNKNHEKMLNCLKILKIRQSSEKELSLCYDYNEGIEYRLKKECQNSSNYNKILKNVTTPRYREPRVKKLILYPLLGITSEVMTKAKKSKLAVKVLAVNKNKKEIIKSYNKEKITLILRNDDYNNLKGTAKKVIDIDLNSSLIYNTICNLDELSDKKVGTLYIDI